MKENTEGQRGLTVAPVQSELFEKCNTQSCISYAAPRIYSS